MFSSEMRIYIGECMCLNSAGIYNILWIWKWQGKIIIEMRLKKYLLTLRLHLYVACVG